MPVYTSSGAMEQLAMSTTIRLIERENEVITLTKVLPCQLLLSSLCLS